MAFLKANNGTLAGQQHALVATRCVMGRHPDCDVVVDAGAVSRHHAQLLRIGDDYYVEDMNSRNGTFVNDRVIIGRQQLFDGDTIRVCDISFTFRTDKSGSNSNSSGTAVLVDDEQDSTASTIMSKMDVTSEEGSVHFSATPDVKLQALMEITRSLGRSVSLDQVLPQVLNSLFKVFLQADRGFIVLKDAQGELVPRCTKVRRESENETIRISRTIVNEVIRSKQAILSADAAADSRFDMSQSIAEFRIRSMICAPLINSQEEVIGALQVDTVNQRNRFRQEDLEVLVCVATQAAIAIDNAQLHENVVLQREFERDLELAREVQKSFLPDRRPMLTGYGFYDFYEPANHIGGDYYDYVPLPDGRLAIVVADVVGHGVAAALLMSKLSASVKFYFASEIQPSKALTDLNRAISPDTFDGRFITLVMVILDPESNQVTVVNAGHQGPLVRRRNGTLQEIGAEASGLPLMIDADCEYRQVSDEIGPGDSLVLFTDGVTEAMNDEELYGVERLRERFSTSDPHEVGESILSDVREFVGVRPASDDMCLVCCGRNSTT